LNSQHISPLQEVSSQKAVALPPKTAEASLVQTTPIEKEVIPASTSVVQTFDVAPTHTVASDTATTIENTSIIIQEPLTVAAEHNNGAGTISLNEKQSNQPLEEETVEEMSESEDEEEEDEDELDVDMVEAEKEVIATEIPLVDVFKAMRSKMKLNLRKSKKTKAVKSFDKDLVRLFTRSRTGGSAVMKKQSTSPASRK
jgi:hypothetical protein